ncbi:MAG: hypothetical protein NXI29_16185 [bacterium]|nr:hypothetical protein [bacterium]
MTDRHAESYTEPVLLIHGTFAYDDQEQGDRWWQRSSHFSVTLERMSSEQGKRIKAVPEGKCFTYISPWWKRFLVSRKKLSVEDVQNRESVFHWSGDNTESARRAAAKLLLAHLQVFDSQGPFHVIAHSHGGSILWDALCQAQSEVKDSKENKPGALPNLKTWTSVGTPFLHFAPQWKCLVFLLPLLLLVYSFLSQKNWLIDSVRQFPDLEYDIPMPTLSAMVVCVVGALFSVALLIRIFWSIYYYLTVLKSPLVDEVKKREFDDIISTLLGFVATLVITWVVYSWFLWGGKFNVTSELAKQFLLVAVWGLAFLVASLLVLSLTLAPFFQQFSLRSKRKKQRECWKVFGDKYLCLAITQKDEAIQSLDNLSHGLTGTLLPRFSVPRLADFSTAHRHLRRPERELNHQSAKGWFFRYLFLPLVILKDWVFAPFYNEVFATLIDDFVLKQLCHRAMGTTFFGPVVSSVSDHPMKTTLAHSDRYFAVYPKGALQAMQQQVGRGATIIVDSIRNQLGAELPLGVDLRSFLEDAMNNIDEKASILFHTSYFEDEHFIVAMASHISGTLDEIVLTSCEVGAMDADSSQYQADGLHENNLMGGFIWWLSRNMVKLCLVMLPAVLAIVVGYMTIYHHSLDYHLNWAGNYESAEIAVNKQITNYDSQSTKIGQWWLAYRALNPDRSDADFGNQLRDSFKRLNFYACLGAKYARLGAVDSASNAFYLSAKEYLVHSRSSKNETKALGCITENLRFAQMYLGLDVYNRRIIPALRRGFLQEGGTGSILIKQLNEKIDSAVAVLSQKPQDLHKTFLKWNTEHPSDDQVVDWIHSGVSDPREKLNKIRLMLGYWKGAAEYAVVLKEETVEGVEEVRELLVNLSPERDGAKKIYVESCVGCIASVAMIQDRESRKHLTELGWKLIEELESSSSLYQYDVYKDYVKLTAIMCRVEQNSADSEAALYKLMGLLADIRERGDLSSEEKFDLAKPLIRILPQFQFFETARLQAESSGDPVFQLEIATSVLLHQCEKSSPLAFGIECTPAVTRLLLENDLIY